MPANYVLLGKAVTTTSGVAAVTLSNIPQTGYTDLKLVVSARATRSGTDISTTAGVTFNGISTAYYADIMIEGGYGTTRSAAGSGQTSIGRFDIPADNAASGIFSNAEMYITDYTSTNAKTTSQESISEDNSSGNYMYLAGGNWNPPSNQAITSVTFTALYTSTFDANSTFYVYGLAAVGATPTLAPFATGGDIITNNGTYWIHTFLSSGVFIPTKTLNCDLLVVAGGAGGGGSDSSGGTAGGGGGAGGYLEQTSRSVATGLYNVIIGAGGAQGPSGAAATPSIVTRGFNGSNTIFGAVTAIGGGGGSGGGIGINGTPNTGGSGGGGNAGGAGTVNGAAATQGNSDGATGYGFAGANGGTTGGYQAGSGGGGAGGAGVAGNASGTSTGGTGGIGGAGKQSSITGTATYYAAGGSGANEGSNASNTSTNSIGGAGGRGATSTAPTAGVANTGSGGGGGSYQGTGGTGGSGIVIIRYPMV
jgi:hypothetical protein